MSHESLKTFHFPVHTNGSVCICKVEGRRAFRLIERVGGGSTQLEGIGHEEKKMFGEFRKVSFRLWFCHFCIKVVFGVYFSLILLEKIRII
jgi:hypothetical protein